ncbi:hypothetical protein B0A50_05203 [Salinomyces thailandicus]|uniref:Glycoside hydrolase family 76 protein n=1 Tax=Salinomyces thailandicus TaxID=706561 RepID=A0A4U0TY57_9PEZI|nr:hypothetical protein B0A50_05203 [Salinomyces thailandica]
MLFKYDLTALLAVAGSTLAVPAESIAVNSDSGYPWRWVGAKQNHAYWFDELESTLGVMQSSLFWNGTYWPETIQWIGAVLDTLVASSERSLTYALESYKSDGLGAQSSTASLQAEIKKYYSEIEAYYDDEDVIQIFGAAYDDAQWVVLEWLEVIKFINQYEAYASSDFGRADIARFAHRAHIFYNIVQTQFDTSLCGGGINWNPALAPYKNAITNELFLSSSIEMYLYFPGDSNTDPYPSPTYTNVTNITLPDLPPLAPHDPLLLSNAIKEYDWFKTHNFTNSQGLIVDGFHISPNQTTCDQRNEMVYTYNQGVLLSGLRQLWEATGNPQYLTDAYTYIESTQTATGWSSHTSSQANQWAGLGRNGIMEDYCDAPANCSQDAQIFKGIYFQHLDVFCEALPTETPLVPGVTYTATASLAASHAKKCREYLPWVEHNAHAALSTRDARGVVGGWWGASFVNKTQEPWPAFAVQKPEGSLDEWNEGWRLGGPPWECRGWHCRIDGRGSHGNGLAMRRLLRQRRGVVEGRQDPNDEGRGRTVETQGSGIGVVKAASDLCAARQGR